MRFGSWTLRKTVTTAALVAVVVAGITVGVVYWVSQKDSGAPPEVPPVVTEPVVTDAPTDVPAVTDIRVPPGTTEGYVGALDDVDVTACDATDAPASFAGTVTNPESTTQSYRIYVSIMAAGKTLAVSQVDVDGVEPGAQQEWSGQIEAGGAGANCILRVERNAAP